MLTQIKLTNFKCFKEETTFSLSKFNLFTGVNGGGKSTLLQSLLLMKQSIEHDIYTSELLLNGSCINLGSFDDVRNRDVPQNQPVTIEFGLNTGVFKSGINYELNFKDTADDTSLNISKITVKQHDISEKPLGKEEKEHVLNQKNGEFYQLDLETNDVVSVPRIFRLIKLTPYDFKTGDEKIDRNKIKPILSDDTNASLTYHMEFVNNFDYFSFDEKDNQDNLNFERIHFISADRIGPQEIYLKSTLSKFPNVGTRGEFAVNLLDKLAEQSVNETLCLGDDATTLRTQTQEWLGKILNPMKLEVPRSKTNVLELFFNDAKPANVGFGYSSILPIIVSGLIAKPNEKIIVENPEIHLHPKAQSALIEFLVSVTNTGVQVFIESHSDHVLNALRIAVLKEKLTPEDANILYFQNNTQKIVQKIPIQKDGRIEDWPENFFDQMDNDLNTLLGI